MAVHIRLQRHGSIHNPFYHVVAADSRRARGGRYLERLGFYDPKSEPSAIELNAERIQFWFSKGALLSETVAKLAKIKKVSLSRKS